MIKKTQLLLGLVFFLSTFSALAQINQSIEIQKDTVTSIFHNEWNNNNLLLPNPLRGDSMVLYLPQFQIEHQLQKNFQITRDFKKFSFDFDTARDRRLAWLDFKRQFTYMSIPEEKQLELISKEEVEFLKLLGPKGITLHFTSKRDRSIKRLKEIMKDDEFYVYVTILSQRVTRLKGQELMSFVKYCNFSRFEFVKSNEYILLVAINQKFSEFKRMTGRN